MSYLAGRERGSTGTCDDSFDGESGVELPHCKKEAADDTTEPGGAAALKVVVESGAFRRVGGWDFPQALGNFFNGSSHRRHHPFA